MKVFELPISTEVNRIVPKNSFDSYATSKHRKRFSEAIEKIRWLNKLALQTVNLEGKDVKEIQIFQIELRVNEEISDLLDLIDRAIPYHIIFVILFDTSYYIRAASKHPNPTNEDIAVIDWVFKSEWLQGICPYQLNLKTSLDFVWSDLCLQLSSKVLSKLPIETLIDYEQRIAGLKRDISKLEASLKRSKQFNRKVEINLELQAKRFELLEIEKKLS